MEANYQNIAQQLCLINKREFNGWNEGGNGKWRMEEEERVEKKRSRKREGRKSSHHNSGGGQV